MDESPPLCKLCSSIVDVKDFCHGCKNYICGACENPDFEKRPQGSHTSNDHQWNDGEN